MSSIDSEINAVRQRLAKLEEIKKAEESKEREKREFPLKVLERIVEEKRKQIGRKYSASVPLARFYDEEKLAMMEPILEALKNITERLDALERR